MANRSVFLLLVCLTRCCSFRINARGADVPLQAIVVNTPKCATGSLQKMFLDLMPCDKQEKELGPNHVLKSCPGTGSFVYRSHDVNESVKYFEEHPNLKLGGANGRCVVLSSFRNPSSWLKSLYFEAHKEELCDGGKAVPTVLADFEDFLKQNMDPTAFKAGDAAALFGIRDFRSLMSTTKERGGYFHMPANYWKNGPFPQCEFIFLQVEAMGKSHEHFLAEWPNIKPMQHEKTDDVCPNSQNIRDALNAHEISLESQKRLFEENPYVEQAWDFYHAR